MKGTIALDIDGTITVEHHTMPKEVAEYLASLVREGWRLIFITGRTFAWGHSVLQSLPIDFYFAVQNGAIILEMPSKKIISKKYLNQSILPKMDAICQNEPSDYVIYAGYERKDQCYYRPDRFSKELLHYLKKRIERLEESWQAVESFDHLPISDFPSVKCFGLKESAKRLAHSIEEKLSLHVPLIRDPFNENYFVAQATHPLVSKGQALLDLIAYTGDKGCMIAAGDDNNDQSMLEIADVKIVMETAPQSLLEMADVIAPSAKNLGIIKGLEKAIKFRGNH